MKQKLKTIGTFLIYLAMFILICIFFTGHGTFIYEAFYKEKVYEKTYTNISCSALSYGVRK